MFKYVDEVLNYAFRMEAKQVYPKGFSGEFTTSSKDDIFENIANGMMIKAFCLQNLGLMQKSVIIAHFTVPVPELEEKKNYYIEKLGSWIASQNHRDKWMLVDGIREWVGEKPHHTTEWWGNKAGKTDRTIRRYWRSSDPADKSVKYLLDQLETNALERLYPCLKDEKIIK